MTGMRLGVVCSLVVGIGSSLASAVDPPAKVAPPLRPPSVRSLAYSPNGKILVAAVGRRDEPEAVVAWEVESRKQLWVTFGPRGSLSFAPDGTAVVFAHSAPTALRLEAATGKELSAIGPHRVVVRAVTYIPTTDLIATGSDGVIRLWDAKTSKVAKELKGGHPAEVSALVASPDGKWLISTGPDSTRAWDVAAGAELKDAFKEDQSRWWYGITFIASDRILFGTSSGEQRIRELPSGKELMKFKNAGGYDGIAYSPTAGLAAFHWPDATKAHIVDLTFRTPTALESARIEKLLLEFDDDSYQVRVAASKAMRAIGSVAEPALRKAMVDGPSAEVKMRARETRRVILEEPLRALEGHTARIIPMAFSPDGKELATGADDGTVRLWDPRTGRELALLEVPVRKSGP